MIDGDSMGGYTLMCDVCEETFSDGFDTFHDAVEFKKDPNNNWKSKKRDNGEWMDCCPDCVHGGYGAGLFSQ